MRCNGFVLSSTRKAKIYTTARCQSEAEPEKEVCTFHRIIGERCLPCGGKLISLDGDLFCEACGAIVPELPEEARLD